MPTLEILSAAADEYDIILLPTPILIIVLAIAHHSRRPGYWRTRMKR